MIRHFRTIGRLALLALLPVAMVMAQKETHATTGQRPKIQSPQRHAASKPSGELVAVAFSPDGKRVAACGFHTIHLFDARSGKPLVPNVYEGGIRWSALTFSPDSRLLAIAGGVAGRPPFVRVEQAGSGECVQMLTGPSDAIYSLAYSPDGSQLAAASYDHTVALWKTEDGTRKTEDGRGKGRRQKAEEETQKETQPKIQKSQSRFASAFRLPSSVLKDHIDAVYSVAFSPDGRLLASASGDRTVKIWDTQTHHRLYTLSDANAELYALAFRPDGKQIAAGGVDKSLRVWNVTRESGSLAHAAIAHNGAILRVVYSHDGKMLYTAGEDKAVKQWDAETLQERRVLPGQSDWPQGLALSPDDQTLAVARHDGSLTLYETAAGHLARTLLANASSGKRGSWFVVRGQQRAKEQRSRRAGETGNKAQDGYVLARNEEARDGEGRLTTRFCAVGAADPDIVQTLEAVNGQQRVTVPCVISGKLTTNGAATNNKQQATSNKVDDTPAHVFRFHGDKGQRLCLEVIARRMGSKLDSQLEVLDGQGRPIERAVLRAIAQTEVTLSDRDSAIGAMRLLAFNELGMNDYLLVGREVARIVAMPKGPDDDTQLRSFRGQRLTYFGTTPEFHSIGTPVYKVEAYPPHTMFSSNGLPVTHLYYQNDDGGPLYGKDSYLEFTPPVDGEYLVRLTDARGQGSEDYKYRLSIHAPRPDFKISLNPTQFNLPKDGALPINVECERYDGFDGTITVQLEGLPAGFTATNTQIETGETSASLLLSAGKDVPTPALPYAVRLVATAQSDGTRLTHIVEPGEAHRITVLPPSNVTLQTNAREVVLHPGEDATLQLTITRKAAFTRRVPIDVRNLPFGVRVQDIGLNGILVPEGETTRSVVLHCESWVKPQTRLLLLQAQVEGGVANAAPPVLLRIEAKTR